MRFADSARRIAPLAWPVFVGQVSVLAFSTVDTLLVARTGATDLAALAVGSAAYVTVFIGFMGVLTALSPIVGQLHGAGRFADAGRQVHQAVWLALALSALGCLLLAFPYPFLALARAGPDVAVKVRGYLLALSLSLPASLLFTVYRGFNTAIARPKAVMGLQVAALLAVKLPLSSALVFGLPSLGVPALGVTGCGIATCVAMWAQVLVGVAVLQRDPHYLPFRLVGRLQRPDAAALRAHLKLGLPIGLSILVEVTGFAFMAIFISRLGTTPVAGHQIAVNIVSLLFMMPLSLANATGTLVAHSIGAGHARNARRLGWHGLGIGCGLAAAMGSAVFLARERVLGLYTHDAAVLAAALPLVAWLVVFHVADAAQTIAAFVLRAYKVATAPVLIYVAALWGVGLGGGYWLAFDVPGYVPRAMQGARGLWMASTVGLVMAALALSGFMGWMLRRQAVRLVAA